MPYGEKSAYAAQAALKKKSPAYKKSSSFKMKGYTFPGIDPKVKPGNLKDGKSPTSVFQAADVSLITAAGKHSESKYKQPEETLNTGDDGGGGMDLGQMANIAMQFMG